MSDTKYTECVESKQHLTFMQIIDEISMMYPAMLSGIHSRLCDMKSDRGGHGVVRPFAGVHTIGVGDFFQLPPVKNVSLIATQMKFVKSEAKGNLSVDFANKHTDISGCNLFAQFEIIQLVEQTRAMHDRVHTAMLEQIRSTPRGEKGPIDSELIGLLKTMQLSQKKMKYLDGIANWMLQLKIGVTGRFEKAELLRHHVIRLGLAKNKPIFRWRHRLNNNITKTFNETELHTLYETNCELYGYFIEGCDAVILNNIGSEKGINNGTKARFVNFRMTNGKTLSDQKTVVCYLPGVVYDIDEPQCIIVELVDGVTGDKNWTSIWKRENNLSPEPDVSVHIPIKRKLTNENIKLYFSNVRPCEAIYSKLAVELDAISTTYKLQGSTVRLLLLILNHRPGRKMKALTLADVYVLLSRVTNSADLLLMELFSMDGLDYLSKLRFPEELYEWYAGLVFIDDERVVQRWDKFASLAYARKMAVHRELLAANKKLFAANKKLLKANNKGGTADVKKSKSVNVSSVVKNVAQLNIGSVTPVQSASKSVSGGVGRNVTPQKAVIPKGRQKQGDSGIAAVGTVKKSTPIRTVSNVITPSKVTSSSDMSGLSTPISSVLSRYNNIVTPQSVGNIATNNNKLVVFTNLTSINCYMNVVLQVLFRNQLTCNVLRDSGFSSDCEPYRELTALFGDFTNNIVRLNATKLIDSLQQYGIVHTSNFADTNAQHDAGDALTFIIGNVLLDENLHTDGMREILAISCVN